MGKGYKHTDLLTAGIKLKPKAKKKQVVRKPVAKAPAPVATPSKRPTLLQSAAPRKTVPAPPQISMPKPQTPPPPAPELSTVSLDDQEVMFYNVPIQWMSLLIGKSVELGYSSSVISKNEEVLQHVLSERPVMLMITAGHPPEKSINLIAQINKIAKPNRVKVLLVGGTDPNSGLDSGFDKLQLEWVSLSIQPEDLKNRFLSLIKRSFESYNSAGKGNEPVAATLAPPPQQQKPLSFEGLLKSATKADPVTFPNARTSANVTGERQPPQPANKSVEELLNDFLDKPQASPPSVTQTEKPEPPPQPVVRTVEPAPQVQSVSMPQTERKISTPPPAPTPPQSKKPISTAKPTAPSKHAKSTIYDRAVKVVAKQFSKLHIEETINVDAIFNISKVLIEEVGNNSDLELRSLNKREYNSLPNRMVNTAIFALKISKHLQYSPSKLMKIAVGALTHDFGMTIVSPDILSKKDALTSEEIKILRSHPDHSSKILREGFNNSHHQLDSELIEIVFQIHERVNGKGYPQGLHGNQINPIARIIATADVFEAFSHPRHYRRTFVAHEAVQEVARLSGIELDPEAVKTLVKELSLFPIDSYVMLNNDEIGRVVTINRSHPLRPVVDIIFNSNKRRLARPRREDLKLSPFLYISRTLMERDLPEKM